MATTAPLDKTAGASGTSTSPSSGATAVTAQANELVVGVVLTRDNNNVTAGIGYTKRAEQDEPGQMTMALEDKNVATTGAQTATATLSPSMEWIAQCATFKVPLL